MIVLKVCCIEQHQHHLRNWRKWNSGAPLQIFWIRKLWEWSPAIWILTSPPSDSDSCSSLRPITLKKCYHTFETNFQMASSKYWLLLLLLMWGLVFQGSLGTSLQLPAAVVHIASSYVHNRGPLLEQNLGSRGRSILLHGEAHPRTKRTVPTWQLPLLSGDMSWQAAAIYLSPLLKFLFIKLSHGFIMLCMSPWEIPWSDVFMFTNL